MTQPLIELESKGLFTHPNRLFLPPGALLVAENVVHRRENVTSRRRGFARYGDELTIGPGDLFRFNGRVIVRDGLAGSASTMKYDSDGSGTWASWAGTFTQPSSEVRMKWLEAAKSFFFATTKGVQVVDSLTGTPRRAGMPKALDLKLSLVGTGGSWFTPDTQVGYRITWRKKDAHARVIQGAPNIQARAVNLFTEELAWTNSGTTVTVVHTAHGYSNSDIITIRDSGDANIPDGDYTISGVAANSYDFTSPGTAGGSGTLSDGKKHDVSLDFSIPRDVVAGDEYEVFRTELSVGPAVTPGLEHRLILSAVVSSGDITAGTITVTDDKDPSFFLANLYTSPSRQGDTLANDRPPGCRFLAQFENHIFFGHVFYPQRVASLQLLDLDALTTGTSTITIGSEVYTAETAEDFALGEFEKVTSFPTTAENLEATMKSLQRAINRRTGGAYHAHYLSQENDAPGIITIEADALDTAAFAIVANSSGTGNGFLPIIPTSGTTLQSTDDAMQHAIARSKADEPEHAPELARGKAGSASKKILGMEKTGTEAIIVWKEDGLFYISGESDGLAGDGFVLDDLDPTVILESPNSLGVLNNAAIGYSNQGTVAVSGGTPLVLSRPQIEDTLRKIAALDAFDGAFAVNYEREREHIFFVPERSADNENTIAVVYNYSTLAWSTWRKPVQSGVFLDSDQKLYLGHNSDKYVLKERKSLAVGTRQDYYDEDIPVTIDLTGTVVNADGATVTELAITYSYAGAKLAAGFLITQGASRTLIESVTAGGGNSYTVILRRLVTGFAAGAATVGLPIPVKVEWLVRGRGSAFSLKQWPFASIYLEDDGGTHRLGFCSDLQDIFEYVEDVRISKAKGWGTFPWGSSPWGDSFPGRSSPVSTHVPLDHQQGRTLRVRYENHYALESVDILMMGVEEKEIGLRSQREGA